VQLADASSPEDKAFDIAVPAGTFVDLDGDTLTLVARLADGADLPDWIRFDGARLPARPRPIITATSKSKSPPAMARSASARVSG
jgi:hypothetical protein